MIIARILDQSEMGVYFIVLMLCFFLKLIADLGTDIAFTKQYPEEDYKGKNSLFFNTFYLKIFFCIVVTICFLLIQHLGAIEFLTQYTLFNHWILILFLLHSLREFLLRTLQSDHRYSTYAQTLVLSAATKTALLLILLNTEEFNFSIVFLIEVTAIAISFAHAVISLKDRFSYIPSFRFNAIKRLLFFGFPVYLNSLLNLGNEKVSEYIVAVSGGPLSVANFGVASRLAEAGTHLFSAFSNVYLPYQSENFANSKYEAATKLANQAVVWICFICTTAIVAFSLWREPIINLLFTEKYSMVANAALLFFGVLLFRSLHSVLGYFAIAAGYKYLPMKISCVSSIFNIILSLYLFRQFGYQGAIAAVLLTQVVMYILYCLYLNHSGFSIRIRQALTIISVCLITLGLVEISKISTYLNLFVLPLFLLSLLLLVPQLRVESAMLYLKLAKTSIDR